MVEVTVGTAGNEMRIGVEDGVTFSVDPSGRLNVADDEGNVVATFNSWAYTVSRPAAGSRKKKKKAADA